MAEAETLRDGVIQWAYRVRVYFENRLVTIMEQGVVTMVYPVACKRDFFPCLTYGAQERHPKNGAPGLSGSRLEVEADL